MTSQETSVAKSADTDNDIDNAILEPIEVCSVLENKLTTGKKEGTEKYKKKHQHFEIITHMVKHLIYHYSMLIQNWLCS